MKRIRGIHQGDQRNKVKPRLTHVLDGQNLGEAETIALKILEKRRHDKPKEPKVVTIRKFSWEQESKDEHKQ